MQSPRRCLEVISNLENVEIATRGLLLQRPWQVTVAGSMLMIQFGDRLLEKKRSGKLVEVGSFSLHVQCPWRLRSPSIGIISGSEDEDVEPFRAWCATGAEVQATHTDESGGLTLKFADERIFETFPATARTDIHAEAWRLIASAGGRKLHLVVGGFGVEIDDGYPVVVGSGS